MISSFSAVARHTSARQQHSRRPTRRKGKHHFFSFQLDLCRVKITWISSTISSVRFDAIVR